MPQLLGIDAVGAEFVDAMRRAWDAGHVVLPIDPRLPAAARAALPRAGDLTDGDALVVATSGTSGEPKGVVLTHDAIAASARASNAALAVDERDKWFACLPLAHIGGLSVVLRALHAGTPFSFTDDGTATLVSVVPTMLRRMDTARYRRVLLGGAAAPDGLAPNVVRTYGMTETGSGVAYDGRPLDTVELRVDGTGQIYVRGPMLLRCYLDGTDPKDADGWLPTGDAGSLTDGVLRVEGRIGDVINTGGEKVWPIAVERALAGMGDIAVAGRPDPEWGQRVVAYVVRSAQVPTLDQLRDKVKETLPAYCAPKEIVLVDALPRTASGKVQRDRL
ncbi:MAG TPA: fatty acid--CoA ligase family protein [Acidimicrobiales bacterium]|nr:fatty acid--CoA ligase family protein [Acidimicrobiales bacterium]